jgi:hypothetical protein
LRLDERHHFGLGVGLAQFRQDVGIKKPTLHRLTSRTGITARPGSIARSRCGDV